MTFDENNYWIWFCVIFVAPVVIILTYKIIEFIINYRKENFRRKKEREHYEYINSEFINNRVSALITRAYGKDFCEMVLNAADNIMFFDPFAEISDLGIIYNYAFRHINVLDKGAEKYLNNFGNNIIVRKCESIRHYMTLYYNKYLELKETTKKNLELIEKVEGK